MKSRRIINQALQLINNELAWYCVLQILITNGAKHKIMTDARKKPALFPIISNSFQCNPE